jgi:hypothetical protein
MAAMHHPPAFCPKHGIFPAIDYGIAPGTIENLYVGNKVGCPKCRSEGRTNLVEVISGVYSADSERLNIILHESVSPEALRLLREIAKRVERGEIKPAEAKKEATEKGLSSRLADLLLDPKVVGPLIGLISQILKSVT